MAEELSELEALAAEYVLGTQDAETRREVESRLQREPEFRARVAFWEARLAGLALTVPEEPVPARVWQAIEARTAAPQAAPRTSQDRAPGAFARLWQSLAVWRGLAMAGAAASLLLAVVLTQQPEAPQGRYVAVLDQGSESPAWLISLNLDRGEITFEPLQESEVAEASLELWLVPTDGGNPSSLGLLDPQAKGRLQLPQSVATGLPDSAVLAVSQEPVGGSPSGLPTGPVLFQGRLLPLDEKTD